MIGKLFRRGTAAVKILFARAVSGGRFSAPLAQYSLERGFLAAADKKSRIEVGRHSHFRRGLVLRAKNGGRIVIGDRVFCNTNVSITAFEEVTIGERVKIANNVVIIDHDHDYRHHNRGYVTAPVHIGDEVWIGANAVILKGVTVGNGAVVAAGAVVTGDVPAGAVAAGVPARIVRQTEGQVKEPAPALKTESATASKTKRRAAGQAVAGASEWGTEHADGE